MIDLSPNSLRSVLCLGAHADDLEIGCGGTVLEWTQTNPELSFHWVVFSGVGERRIEAVRSAESFLGAAASSANVQVHSFRDGFFPSQHTEIKETFEALKGEVAPDIILTHFDGDAHQDHRVVSELTWNTFRNHLILEYEIPKYDADLQRPNVFVTFDEATCEKKISLLLEHFPTQAQRSWFDRDTFRGLMRLRGVECASPRRFAEAFHARKLRISLEHGRNS